MGRLAERLRTATVPVVLDGGLSTALEAAGADLSGSLWTGRLVSDSPERVVAAHREFVAAGAEVLITASYQLSALGTTGAVGAGPVDPGPLWARSVDLARQATEGASGVLVAASVGPYGAALADGSEYRGRYGVGRAVLRDFHGPRLEGLIAAGPDAVAVETIPDVEEVEVLVDLLAGLEAPDTWVSVSCSSGGRTCAGDPVAEVIDAVAGLPSLAAVGANCTPVDSLTDALEQMAACSRVPLVAYPNGGGSWDPVSGLWSRTGTAGLEAEVLGRWWDLGVRLVGGCCGWGPEEIGGLARLCRSTPDWNRRSRARQRRS